MQSIVKAVEKDFRLLAGLGRKTFVESHGRSASPEVIDSYLAEKYNDDTVKKELADSENLYHILYHDHKPAGYSKIILNMTHPNIPLANVTKLERLYLLKEFYKLKLGLALFNFNLDLSKMNRQEGMWLYVWTGNHRAVQFYNNAGFTIVGSYQFKLSPSHANPNHQLFLKY